MSLEGAGLGPTQEQVYRLLVRVGDAPALHVAEVLGLSETELAPVLADLQSVGLVTSIGSDPPRYAPTPPDVGFAAPAAPRHGGARPGPQHHQRAH